MLKSSDQAAGTIIDNVMTLDGKKGRAKLSAQ